MATIEDYFNHPEPGFARHLRLLRLLSIWSCQDEKCLGPLLVLSFGHSSSPSLSSYSCSDFPNLCLRLSSLPTFSYMLELLGEDQDTLTARLKITGCWWTHRGLPLFGFHFCLLQSACLRKSRPPVVCRMHSSIHESAAARSNPVFVAERQEVAQHPEFQHSQPRHQHKFSHARK